MSNMNELVEWLQQGVSSSYLTAEEALKWIGKRAEEQTLLSVRSTKPAGRVKKDGTPWGKRGSKKQPNLPLMSAANE